jgi:spore cortex formation protein SpoVR/YcgB (stage V sporulation)
MERCSFLKAVVSRHGFSIRKSDHSVRFTITRTDLMAIRDAMTSTTSNGEIPVIALGSADWRDGDLRMCRGVQDQWMELRGAELWIVASLGGDRFLYSYPVLLDRVFESLDVAVAHGAADAQAGYTQWLL